MITKITTSLFNIITSGILFLPLLTSCSEDSSLQLPGEVSELENVTIYQNKTQRFSNVRFNKAGEIYSSNEIVLGRIRDVTVDEKGDIYIPEQTQNTAQIHVFDKNGSYKTSMGRFGDGPGEFRSIGKPFFIDGKLFMLDTIHSRINIFSTQLHSYMESISLRPEN